MVTGLIVKVFNKAEFVQDLANVNQKLKQHSAEVRLAAAAAAGQAQSFEAQQSKLNKLNQLLDSQKDVYGRLKTRLGELQQQHRANSGTHDKLVNSYNTEAEKLASIEAKLGANSSAYSKQQQVVQSLAKEVAISTRNHQDNEREISNITTKLTNAETACLKTSSAIEKLNQSMKSSSSNAAQSSLEHGKLRDVISSQESQLNNLKKQYVDVTLAHGKGSSAAQSLAQQITNLSGTLHGNKEKFDAATKSANDLDKSMSSTGGEVNNFSGKVNFAQGILVGFASAITTQVLTALRDLSTKCLSVGMDFEAGMSHVQAISGVSSTSMGELAKKAKEIGAATQHMATDITQGYGYMAMAGWKDVQMLGAIDGAQKLVSASGEDFGRVVDILTDVLSAMGKTAKDSGEFVDILAATAANSNTSVSMMGETFKYAAPVAGTLGSSMKDLALMIGLMANNGIKADKAGTSIRSILLRLINPTDEVAAGMEKIGLQVVNADGSIKPLITIMNEMRAKMSKLSDAEKAQVAAMIAGKQAVTGLLAVVNSSPADFASLKQAIDESDGAADKMAKTMLNNGKGAVTLLKSKIESLQISLYEKLKPAFMGVVQAASGVADVFGEIIKYGLPIVGAVGAITAAFVGLQTATTIANTLGLSVQGLVAAFSSPLGAITLLAGAIATVITIGNEYSNWVNSATEEVQEHTKKVDALKESWDKTMERQSELMSKGMAHILNLQALRRELTEIVDSNGKVKKGYEERAKFITDELSKALDVEIKDINNVIEGYDKITKAIDKQIEHKRAAMIVENQEAGYKEATEKQAENLENMREQKQNLAKLRAELKAEQLKHPIDVPTGPGWSVGKAGPSDRIKKLEASVEEEQENYNKSLQQAKVYNYTIAQYETNREELAAGHYDKIKNLNIKKLEDGQSIGEAERAETQKQIDNQKDDLEVLRQLYQDTGNEMYKTQVEIGERRLKELDNNMKAYGDAVSEKLEHVPEIWDEELQKQAETITGKKYTFKKSGDGTITAFIDGQAAKSGSAAEMATWLGEQTAICLGAKTEEAKNQGRKMGQEFIDCLGGVFYACGEFFFNLGNFVIGGIINGIKGAWNRLTDTLGFVVESVKDFFTGKSGFDINSPSKVTAKIGSSVTEGLAVGIESGESFVLNSVRNVVGSVNNSLQKNLIRPNITGLRFHSGYKATDFRGSIDSASIRNRAGGVSGGVSATNNFNMFTEFMDSFTNKLADKFCNKVKVELDGEQMGKFVDRQVEQMVYR